MRVMVAGSFDVLHAGHVNLLLYCRELAGYKGEVFVSIDSDDKINKDKGSDRPVFEWLERASAIESLSFNNSKIVDKTFMHTSNEYLEHLIKLHSPDAIVVGSDYDNKKVIGEEYAKVYYFPRDHRFSSTKVIEACRQGKQ